MWWLFGVQNKKGLLVHECWLAFYRFVSMSVKPSFALRKMDG